MAKSYVTRFTEYVKDCKDNLTNILKTKKQNPNSNDTLSGLISRVANISTEGTGEDNWGLYVRDPALPDLDTLFDNDPLREVNGGDYMVCTYAVCYFQNYTGVKYQERFIFTSSYWADRIEFSDGTVYDKTTTTLNHTVGPEGIYTLADGKECYIIKVYSLVQKSYNQIPYLGSKDTTGIKAFDIIFDSNMNEIAFTSYLKYYRLMNSYGNCPSISILYNSTTVIIDSDTLNNAVHASYCQSQLIYNGLFSSNSSLDIGLKTSTSSTNYSYLKLPEKTATSTATQVSIRGSLSGYLYVPDWVNNLDIESTNSYKTWGLKTAHLGNGFTVIKTGGIFSNSNNYFNNLQNLTLSPGFGQNFTTATSLYVNQHYSLSIESLKNICENLADRTGKTVCTAIFSYNQRSYLSDDDITLLQAKNWTVTVS